MKVAVIGSGGREFALAKALSESPTVKEVWAYPGSVGMAQFAKCKNIAWTKTDALLTEFKNKSIDLVVIGPEAPLVEGLADQLRAQGLFVFGPNKKAAQLEGSKVFSKEFMLRAGVPTAKSKTVTNENECLALTNDFEFPIVVKADGLAAGKGVYICKDQDELQKAASDIFVKKIFSETHALAEEFISGWELSYIIITDGERYEVCPLAQDHKTLLDGGKGPNTGGMGVIGPIAISKDLDQKIRQKVVEPSLKQLKKMDLPYQGALFIGLMINDKNEPYVLEYNVRFGDPETQIIMPLIEGDIGQILLSCAKGEMQSFKVKDQFAACVILAAEGYPENVVKGSVIEGDLKSATPESYFVHAGVSCNDKNDFVVNGGRVLGAVGLADSKDKAIAKAYQQASLVSWKGVQFRKDIGRYFN